MNNTKQYLTKAEIALKLGVPVESLSLWADQFTDWFDLDSRFVDKTHDEYDILIFKLIADIDSQINHQVGYPERRQIIESGLWNQSLARNIRKKREINKSQPEVQRWSIVNGELLRRDLDWLSKFAPFVKKLVVFGCWAADMNDICAESFALTWILEADEVVVVDKSEDYIRNAQIWLQNICKQYQFFQNYKLRFIVGDLADKIQELLNDYFDLAFCRDVLYNLEEIPEEFENALNEMGRVIRPGGWLVAVEEKIGVEFELEAPDSLFGLQRPIPKNEPQDISNLFLALGLNRHHIDDTPYWTYIFQKP